MITLSRVAGGHASAVIAIPSVFLLGWSVMALVGFSHPFVDLVISVVVLVGVPLGWWAVWWGWGRGAAADRRSRARIARVIDERLIVTVFQPIVVVATGRQAGFEALSRFSHMEPARGPDVWFCEATRLGLGIELEFVAAQLALEAAHDLPRQAYVSINLSPAAILTGRFAAVIESSGLDIRRVVLEITEHSTIEDYTALSDSVAGLREAGLRLAVDDAGAGYASFRHILALEPDFIKLDRSLIADIDADIGRCALARAVVAFAEEVGATVIGEGVESDAEFRAVRALGVPAVQGYLVGRPNLAPTWADAPRREPGSCRAGTEQAPMSRAPDRERR